VVYYLELGDYCRIAAEVLGLDPEQTAELPNIGLADSALAAPRAGFGDYEAFPTLIEKAAVLVERLARNHPLPDGNKRSAFLALERFLAANDQPILDPDPDTDVPMMERIAAGEVTQGEIEAWLEKRTTPRSSS
jgi:death-on-curing protein